MAKPVWIRANLSKCIFMAGEIKMELVCGHYNATGECVCEEAVYAKDFSSLLCFTRGIVNSSLTALVEIAGGWAPLGRISSKFELRNGVGIQKIVNDFSRDGDIECVRNREDAEKLCLLAQHLPNCTFTLHEVADANGFEVDRVSVRTLRSLKIAVESKLNNSGVKLQSLILDPNLKTLVLAGKN